MQIYSAVEMMSLLISNVCVRACVCRYVCVYVCRCMHACPDGNWLLSLVNSYSAACLGGLWICKEVCC